MPNLEYSKKARRKKLTKTWQSKEWKDKKKAFIGERGCSWCGSQEYLTVHHPFRNGYGPEIYMDFYLSKCVILCRRCHAALHKGLVLCQCKKHYRPFDAEECFTCYSTKYPEVLKKVKQYKEDQKEKQKVYRKKKYQEQKKKQDEWNKVHPKPKPQRKKVINTNKTNK